MILNPNHPDTDTMTSAPMITKTKLGFDIASLVSNDDKHEQEATSFRNKMAFYRGGIKSNKASVPASRKDGQQEDRRYHPYFSRQNYRSPTHRQHSGEEINRTAQQESEDSNLHYRKRNSPPTAESLAKIERRDDERKTAKQGFDAVRIKTEVSPFPSEKLQDFKSTLSPPTPKLSSEEHGTIAAMESPYVGSSIFKAMASGVMPFPYMRNPVMSPHCSPEGRRLSPHVIMDQERVSRSASSENRPTFSTSPPQHRLSSSAPAYPSPNMHQIPSPTSPLSPRGFAQHMTARSADAFLPPSSAAMMDRLSQQVLLQAAAAAAAGLGGGPPTSCISPTGMPSPYLSGGHPGIGGIAPPMDPMTGAAMRNPFLSAATPYNHPWFLRQAAAMGRPINPTFAGKLF